MRIQMEDGNFPSSNSRFEWHLFTEMSFIVSYVFEFRHAICGFLPRDHVRLGLFWVKHLREESRMLRIEMR